MLCCVLLIFLGILIGIIIYKVCLDKKQLADNLLSFGQNSNAHIQYDYEMIKPLFTHWLPCTEDKTGIRKDVNIPTYEEDHTYYELDKENNYTLNKMACNCQGAYNCHTYIM